MIRTLSILMVVLAAGHRAGAQLALEWAYAPRPNTVFNVYQQDVPAPTVSWRNGRFVADPIRLDPNRWVLIATVGTRRFPLPESAALNVVHAFAVTARDTVTVTGDETNFATRSSR